MVDVSPDERTRLERLRDAATGVGTDVLAQILSKLATGAL
jgi:hypothetical protein